MKTLGVLFVTAQIAVVWWVLTLAQPGASPFYR